MEGGCGAFIKGGCGCLIAFAFLALLAVLAGGRAHIDLGGALCLFVIGGLIGLALLLIYNKGRSDATPSKVEPILSDVQIEEIEPHDDEGSLGPAEAIQCLECGYAISTDVDLCPKCGWSWKSSEK